MMKSSIRESLLILSLFLSLSVSTLSQSVNLEKGLVAKYPFSGSARDVSGHGHDGTVNGARPVEDRYGNASSAYDFNGTADYISFPAARYFSGDFTVSAWVNMNEITRWCRLFDFGNGHDAQNVFLALSKMFTGNPTGDVFGPAGRNYKEVVSEAKIPLNQWNHLVFTLEGNTARVYLNRELVAAQTNFLQPPAVNRSNNFLGKSNWPQDPFTKATIDDFIIYDRALNEAEIHALYLEGDPAQEILHVDFEHDKLHSWMKESHSGTFTQSPGIKKIHTLDTKGQEAFQRCGCGSNAYAFGLGSCMGSCPGETAALTIEFPEPYPVTSLSFKEMEWKGNTSTRGEIEIDGEKLSDVTFGKRSVYDRTPDTACRDHSIFIGKKISKIAFVVSGINQDGEILIDDIIIRGSVSAKSIPGLFVYISDLDYPCERDGRLGKITLGIDGGRPPYSIRWSTFQHTQTINDLKAGSYYARVRDASGLSRRIWVPLEADCPHADTRKYDSIPFPKPPSPESTEKSSSSPRSRQTNDCNHFIERSRMMFCDHISPFTAFYLLPYDPDWEWSWEVPEGVTIIEGLPTGWHHNRIWLKPDPGFIEGTLKATATLEGKTDGMSDTPAKGKITICESEVTLFMFRWDLTPPLEIRGNPTVTPGIVSDFSVQLIPDEWYLWELDPPEFGTLYYDGAPGPMDTILVLPSGKVNQAVLSVQAENSCDESTPVTLTLTLENPTAPPTGNGPLTCEKKDLTTPMSNDGSITAAATGLPEGIYRIRITEASGKRDSCVVTLSAPSATPPESKGVGKMSLEKGDFSTGEQIRLTYKVSSLLVQQDAWIGMIPSETMHGTSSVNYQNKVGYKSLRNVTSGEMTFVAPPKEGDYDFRLNNSMNNGFELGSITFRVKKLMNTCTRRFFPATATPLHPSAPDGTDGQIEVSYSRLPAGEYTIELLRGSDKLAWCTQLLASPEEPDTTISRPPAPPSLPPPSMTFPDTTRHGTPDTSMIARSDTFEITRAGKRISRMFLMDLSDTSVVKLQRKLDSLGATGWALNKDVTLFGYFVATHDTLSSPQKKEKFRYHVFRGQWTNFVDSANVWGAKGYELTLFNVLSGISMKDETSPAKAGRQFEYTWIPDFLDAVSSERRYESNASRVTELLNQFGDQGWELFMISSDACLLQRVKGNTSVKYQYKLVPMENVTDVKGTFTPLGNEGWEYCLWPFTFHSASFGTPFVVKRLASHHPPLEYRFQYANTTGLNATKWNETMSQMQAVINDPTTKGWKYMGGLVLDGTPRAFHNLFGMVFMVEKSLK